MAKVCRACVGLLIYGGNYFFGIWVGLVMQKNTLKRKSERPTDSPTDQNSGANEWAGGVSNSDRKKRMKGKLHAV